VTDLTDRMRTCAAFLCGEAKAGDGSLRDFGKAIIDARDLLIAAAHEIDILTGPIDLGEPMEVIPPVVTPPPVVAQTSPMWVDPGGPLPGVTHSGTVSPRACPKCGSRANKRVTRVDKVMMLVCPACGHQWRYRR